MFITWFEAQRTNTHNKQKKADVSFFFGTCKKIKLKNWRGREKERIKIKLFKFAFPSFPSFFYRVIWQDFLLLLILYSKIQNFKIVGCLFLCCNIIFDFLTHPHFFLGFNLNKNKKFKVRNSFDCQFWWYEFIFRLERFQWKF